MYFLDRADAGRLLARELIRLRDARDLIVLALPRGGVPVGMRSRASYMRRWTFSSCENWGSPGGRNLQWLLASGGVRVLNPDVVSALGWHAEEAIKHATNGKAKNSPA